MSRPADKTIIAAAKKEARARRTGRIRRAAAILGVAAFLGPFGAIYAKQSGIGTQTVADAVKSVETTLSPSDNGSPAATASPSSTNTATPAPVTTQQS